MFTQSFKSHFIAAAALIAGFTSVHAAVVTETWTYAGGGLDPATYGGNFKPATLIPDAAADYGSDIDMSGYGITGGLGSSSYTYGGIYTLFSYPISFSLNAPDILTGVQTISLSFAAGGGTVYDSDDVTLSYNIANPNLTALDFTFSPPFVISTPIGDQNLRVFTWTWDVASLGAASGTSINWTAGEHTFITNIAFTQHAVPEPSSIGLLAVGAGLLLWARKRTPKVVS